MPHAVIVGVDGSPESRAAAEWAAGEARLRGLPLSLVCVLEPVPEPVVRAPLLGAETRQRWSDRIPQEYAEELHVRHPDVEVGLRWLTGRPGQLLPGLARDDRALLVLGSRGLGGVAGALLGSVALAAVAHAERPVVLVRAGVPAAREGAEDLAGDPCSRAARRPVVVGVDAGQPPVSVLAFAFDAAARRRTSLRVLHAGAGQGPTAAVAETLRPWCRAFPHVTIVDEVRPGGAAPHLVAASWDASLIVVGRRSRRFPVGTRVGPVTHGVLHRAVCPVAVVPHA
ncbi:universal stress protein [Streptomyces sp. G45]|uniref:universal stress protein n=1 Tax=Streptomyces sp. G45 TaxID=3406627 RepID=UPI003C160A17